MRIGMAPIALLVAAGLLCGREALADGEATGCGNKATRGNVVTCALRTSLKVQAQKESESAARGRVTAAEPVLPSSPVVSVSAGQRSGPGFAPLANWSASLSQEIEVAGQRDARIQAATEGVEAEKQRTATSERDVALAAWRAYFEAVGAREEAARAKQIEAIAARIEVAVSAGATNGLSSSLDAELAGARALSATQSRLAAERAEKAAVLALATLWGRDPSAGTLTVEGELTPLAGVEEAAAKTAAPAVKERPEALALDAEKRSFEATADELRRARVPNLTVSVFVQKDAVNELFVGAGVTIPIPLPQPVGRTNAGEIAEAEALARRSSTEAEAVRRNARGEAAAAIAEYRSRKTEADAITPERLAKAEKSLASIATEIEAGRLALKDAAQAQQALVDVLLSRLRAQKALCLASVEVVRAAGLPVEGAAK